MIGYGAPAATLGRDPYMSGRGGPGAHRCILAGAVYRRAASDSTGADWRPRDNHPSPNRSSSSSNINNSTSSSSGSSSSIHNSSSSSSCS